MVTLAVIWIENRSFVELKVIFIRAQNNVGEIHPTS